ncbi:MAG: 2-C-methyl-D-erythritol 4-phosphate cytidylyltransferase [Chlorobi bacterium]|nr:2-C-methyl-D-erythritol 4-phosphate cytidylyltransferase [Chlorobiota bacterium]
MTITAYAIIAASGIGKRMQLQNGQSKQLLEIGGFPVIYHTLNAFEQASTIASVHIATRTENIETLQEMAMSFGFRKIRAIIEGGKERQDSIRNCIRFIEREMANSRTSPDIIMVHDGARPFIRPSEIDDISRLSMQYGACVPATKPKDTIKFIASDPGFFGETPDRNRLLQVQTPQSFRSGLLIQAHEQAELEGWYGTDDASLVERFFPEQEIRVYETGYHNLKITTPEDVEAAEAIYRRLRAGDETVKQK